nr:unnamed protein product [Callosobruchus analis]
MELEASEIRNWKLKLRQLCDPSRTPALSKTTNCQQGSTRVGTEGTISGSASSFEGDWWLTNLEKKSEIFHPAPQVFLTTDASNAGWEAHIMERTVSGTWTSKQTQWHINLKEMWLHYIRGWSAVDEKLLEKAWRPSTLKTYSTAWKRWTEWAKNE